MRRWGATIVCLGVSIVPTVAALADRPEKSQPGRDFQSTETRQLEADEAANPGYLWLEDGRKLWRLPAGDANRSCESCHGASEEALAGVAARYPRVDVGTGKLVNIEGQINICRVTRQRAPAFRPESPELLGLTVLVTHRSRGMPRKVVIDGPAASAFAQGRTLWMTRQGQLDLACSQCHDDNVGKSLRGDRISQGQSDGWPAYRLEWQSLGSLHRRLRACNLGVRAEVLDYGADDYLALELYLAWRGGSLPISSPGIRR